MAQASPALPGGSFSLRGSAKRQRRERTVRVLFLAAALTTIVISVFIVLAVLVEALSFLAQIDLSQLTGIGWFPRRGIFDVTTLLLGTLIVTAIAMVIATPIGLASAIYLAEYATPRVRKIVKPILEVLAGVPTIVFGYFALAFFTPEILKPLLGSGIGTNNQLAAGIIVGLLVLPTIASVSEDSMSAVPQSLREGAFGMGANRMQVSLRVIFPAALSGIVAAIVLGASRAFGETVVILLAAGNGQLLPRGAVTDPGSPAGNMAAFIAGTASGDIPTGSIEYKTIFAVGFTLFVITLFLNAMAIRLVNKYRQVYE
jgi:phosphate transport system permease protein